MLEPTSTSFYIQTAYVIACLGLSGFFAFSWWQARQAKKRLSVLESQVKESHEA
ncbi:MAG: hypothetical protein ACPGXY_01015 [Alphaproteobacteria bacterium]